MAWVKILVSFVVVFFLGIVLTELLPKLNSSTNEDFPQVAINLNETVIMQESKGLQWSNFFFLLVVLVGMLIWIVLDI